MQPGPHAPNPGTPIGTATGQGAAETEVVGIRVRMFVSLTDPSGRPIPGAGMYRDVTMNVSPHTSIEEALAAAIAYAESGQLGRRSNETYPVHVLVAGVARVVEGGFDDPSLPGVT